jgi:hypothetical protein
MTETVIPMIPDSHEPMRQLVTVLCQLCASCSRQVAGELQLRQGQLTGLANLTRQVKKMLETKMTFADLSLAFSCSEIFQHIILGFTIKYKCTTLT